VYSYLTLELRYQLGGCTQDFWKHFRNWRVLGRRGGCGIR